MRVIWPVSRARLGASVSCLLALLGVCSSSRAQDCHVDGDFRMSFGLVNPGGRAASTGIQYACAPDYSEARLTRYYLLCLYIGRGDQSADQTGRRMGNYNGAYLRYDLFSDPAHSQLIGAPGSSPVYQLRLVVPPGAYQSARANVHGWVYPGQVVPATHLFMEHGHEGRLRWRYGIKGFPESADCSQGGIAGGSTSFASAGVWAAYDNSCWVSAADLDFGRGPPPLTPVLASTRVSLRCPVGTQWRIGLDKGLHHDGSQRRMAGAGGYLAYQLYQDEARSKPWGNDAASMLSGSSDASGSIRHLTVYGRVPAQPSARVGSYQDSVVLTLYY